MADDITLNAGSGGATLATDEDAGASRHYQVVKLADGTANSETRIVAGNGTASGALRVTIASDTTGVLSIDDNSGSLTVDNAGTFATQVDGDALTALQLIDDIVATDDAAFTAATSKGVPAMGFVTTDSVNSGDVGALAMTTERELHTALTAAGFQSSNNTTTTPLSASATYTGTAEQNDYQYVMVSCIADTAGTLFFDFSVDGTNYNTFPVSGFAVAANTHEIHTAVKGSRYFRVRFTDGGSGQSTFRLYTYYSNTNLALNSPLNVDLSQDSDAIAVKAVLVAQAGGTGDFANIQSTAGGNLNISIAEASDGLDIGAGNAGTETIRVSIASDDVNLSGILADTANMDTNLATVAGAVAGSEMQVDIVSGTVTANLSATDNAVLDVIETNTSGNTSHYRNIDANAEAEIKGSAGTLKWLHAMNLTAAKAYVHLYDQVAASVTPGTTTPTYTFPIPTQGDTNGAGFVLPAQIEFSTGITLVVTTTLDGSTGDPGTNGVIINAGYV